MITKTSTFSDIFKLTSDLYSRDEAACYLGVTSKTQAVWACTKRYNLPFVKIGRLAKYRKTDLDAFIARRTVNSPQEI
jgi:excisionase family DNA binding protein